MTQHHENWPLTVKHDFINSFLGNFIASGCFRDVYEVLNQSDLVAKVENGACSFHNVLEWNVWNEVQGTKWARWFAPCIRLSPNGAVLIQARTTTLPKSRYPKQLPDFLSDLKPSNFGIYKGRVVCHDYGLTSFIDNALAKARITKVQKGDFYDPPTKIV